MKEEQEAIQALRGFIGLPQMSATILLLKGEERSAIRERLLELAKTVQEMPKTYETQEMEFDNIVVQLHYFYGNMDWYITEKDVDKDGKGQIQAFGLANLGYGSELGCICIPELLGVGAELDYYWTKKTLKQVMTEEM